MRRVIDYLRIRIDMQRQDAESSRTQMYDYASSEELNQHIEESLVNRRTIQVLEQVLAYASEQRAEAIDLMRSMAASFRRMSAEEGGNRHLDGCAHGMETAARYVETGWFVPQVASPTEKAAPESGNSVSTIPSIAQVAIAGNVVTDVAADYTAGPLDGGSDYHGGGR